MRLNKAQKEAACHFQGPCMVLAGPGSGKTLTIAARIQYLIEERKVRPEEILVITFTRAAAREMKERFQRLFGSGNAPVTFGTFHGIYFGILKWAYSLTAENIMSEEDRLRLLQQILALPEIGDRICVEEEQDYIRRLLSEISRMKNSGCRRADFRSEICPETFQDICRIYEKKQKEMQKIDFDDMLLLCWQLFRSRPDILRQWQERFRYILVDEFQDVNRIQYEILKMLALPQNNLFVVGDDDQSIYKFRGAKPGIMLGFPKDYPGTKKILLDVNYRSDGNILKGALRVIGNNKNRYVKKLKTSGDNGDCVHVQELRDPAEEGKYIIQEVQKRLQAGVPLTEIAVLFRTNMDGRLLSEMLLEYQIPFQMKEQVRNIYEHFIGRNLRSYLELASGKRDRKFFLDIMNCPKRYLSRESVERAVVSFDDMRNFYLDKDWMQDRIDTFEQDIIMMRGKSPYAAIQYVRKKIGYDEYLREYAQARRVSPEDLQEILLEIQEKSKEFSDMEAWFAYLDEYARELAAQKKRERSDRREGVQLMTMHGAKGLEFDTVFILGGNEGVIPSKKARLDEEIEEERRMFYVAMTRAKKKLIICYTKTKNGKDLDPSRFVEELLLRKKKH